MKKIWWLIVDRRGHPFSLPGDMDTGLYGTRKRAKIDAEEWFDHMDKHERRRVCPLKAVKVEVTRV